MEYLIECILDGSVVIYIIRRLMYFLQHKSHHHNMDAQEYRDFIRDECLSLEQFYDKCEQGVFGKGFLPNGIVKYESGRSDDIYITLEDKSTGRTRIFKSDYYILEGNVYVARSKVMWWQRQFKTQDKASQI